MRYFIGFIITIVLIISLVLLLFGGGGGKAKVPATAKTLESYASTDAQVRLTIDGPINADQTHQQVRITVDQTDVTYQQIQGYDSTVVNNQTFANNQNSYYAFLRALVTAGFTKGNNNSDLRDETGYCPLADRFVFELSDGGSDIERYWTTTCGSPKTYLGNTKLTVELFQAQVPNNNGLAAGLDL